MAGARQLSALCRRGPAFCNPQQLRLLFGSSAAAHVASSLPSLSNASSAARDRTAPPDADAVPGRPAAAAGGRLPLAVPAFGVWGANTNVGKTLVSVGLAHAAAALKVPLSYIKPVQTGFPTDSDARLVALACGGTLDHGAHAAEAVALSGPGAGEPAPPAGRGGEGPPGPSPRCTTLFAWQHAVSPHLAVKLEGRAVSDDELVAATAQHVRAALEGLRARATEAAAAAAAAAAVGSSGGGRGGGPSSTAGGGSGAGAGGAARALLLLETAGGVTSPAPSGRLTCDVLRPLRLPAVLVGDPRLGGIAATLSAYDSLVMRGWDVEAVVLVGQSSSYVAGAGSVPLDNLTFLREHLAATATSLHRMGAPPPLVLGVPACGLPPQGHDVRRDGLDPSLAAWLVASRPAFTTLLEALQRRHADRLTALAGASAAAESQLWWPFTQHAGLTPGSAATVIDSRCGDTWTALAPATQGPQGAKPSGGSSSGAEVSEAALVPLYDASCSWWTQAATPALQPEVARAVSYAAGRYLHVLFPEVAHAPALAAAAALLGPGGPGAGWAARVFFSDDGSTAIEVALKMAFRKFLADRGELDATGGAGTSSSGGGGELQVLGLQGAYHGDTLGAQDCVAPSVFNGPLQAPWYRGRGLFLEPPYVGMTQGRWQLMDPPAWLAAHHAGPLPSWASLEELLSSGSSSGGGSSSCSSGGSSGTSGLEAAYRSYIGAAIDEYEGVEAEKARAAARGSARLAACIMEPLLQGAGGMLLIDPAFQRAMAQVARTRGLPLILDEVFSGLFRAGHLSAAAALRVTPDIACYAKLLTAGAAPLAVTLASREVFQAFSGPSKLFALLHGHSYTAYPIGCAAASAALELLTQPDTNPNLCAPCRCPKTPRCESPCGRLLPLFDEKSIVTELSHHPLVSRVVAMGTVLAVELRPAQPTHGSGYGSVSAVQVVRRLRDEYGIYARPLGPVVYVMVPPTAPRETAGWLAGSLKAALDRCAAAGGGAAEEGVVV